MKTVSDKAEKKLPEILLPHQMDRLQELAVQRLGPLALADPKIQGELKLSDDQKQKIRSLQDSIQAKAQEVRDAMTKARGLDDDARRAAFQAMRPKFDALRAAADDAGKQALEILQADQKANFEKMQGDKFEFPAPSIGRGRGPRGPSSDRPSGDKNE
jgi:hypothetical protein